MNIDKIFTLQNFTLYEPRVSSPGYITLCYSYKAHYNLL